MAETDSRVLFPPLLLATDGSSSARLAQKLMRPLMQLFQAGEPEALPEASQVAGKSGSANQGLSAPQPKLRVVSILLMVLTVQPRIPRRSTKKAVSHPSPEEESAVVTTKVVEESNPVVPGRIPSLEELTVSVQEDFPSLSNIHLEVRQGRPTTEILNCARSIEAGLIAVGHRGKGGMRELLLGSVSTAIARYAPCSVLITRNSGQPITAPNLNHVLLVVDESVGTRSAIAATRQLIPAGIQTITLLHIQSPLNANYLLGPFFSPTPSWQLSQSLQNVQKEQGMEVLQRAIAALHNGDRGVTITPRLQTGDAGPLICQVAQELQANLIILGSDASRRTLLSPLQGRRARQPAANAQTVARPIRNTRLSITDDYVIHYAPCPVLLCRSPQFSSN